MQNTLWLRSNKIIEFITLKDPIVRVLKLLKGEIDLIQGNLPPEIIAWLDQKKSIHVKKKIGSRLLKFCQQYPYIST